MKRTIKTTLLLAAILVNTSVFANINDFRQADKAAKILNSLVKGGPTDTECAKIEVNFSDLAVLLPRLSKAQQSALWEKNPYMAGIACLREIGHAWYGNDCSFQCGSYSECQARVAK